ncbi:hypothetical protein J2T55_000482 [Methylohalomonas lacus]|uniref:Lipid A deacylase LpxR family protein n=1 Tax=Methylohalomonas lacus TaxID=398773 RepID=A0AAE3HJP0_9GAMM|nr:lipid A deacylase LpxR family protein [Methylohalomonas lacus]MCS3902478.1 hypothetical protein [Methylohalomonas lacus]
MNRSHVPILLFGLLLATAGHSEEPSSNVHDSSTFTFLFENDLFGNSDQNYTSGVQLNWMSPDLSDYRDSKQLPAWAVPIVENLPFINEPGLQRNVGFGIGQKIFTPENTDRRDLIEDDQPYAGWLYMSAAFHNKNQHKLDTFEIQFGMVGPAALGEETQNFVHDLRGIRDAQGWDNQLENEPGIILIAERKNRLLQEPLYSRFGYDVISHYGGGLGNVHTYASAGIEGRIGWNVPVDFGSARIRPGGDSNAPVDSSDPRFSRESTFSAHLFAGVTGNVVARNIFLDGNSFSNSHSVDRRWLVGDLAIGASVMYGRLKLTYAQILRTREFDEQNDNHEFGSVSLSYTF